MTAGAAALDTQTSTIRRITEGRNRWRVLVQTWRDQNACHGRLVFRMDDVPGWITPRESAPLLHGTTVTDVLSLAHDLPDDRLRRVLYSLS